MSPRYWYSHVKDGCYKPEYEDKRIIAVTSLPKDYESIVPYNSISDFFLIFFSDKMFAKNHSVDNIDAIVFTDSKVEVTHSNSIQNKTRPLEDWEDYGYHELDNTVKYSIFQTHTIIAFMQKNAHFG